MPQQFDTDRDESVAQGIFLFLVAAEFVKANFFDGTASKLTRI
jgi:hypothetical protein